MTVANCRSSSAAALKTSDAFSPASSGLISARTPEFETIIEANHSASWVSVTPAKGAFRI